MEYNANNGRQISRNMDFGYLSCQHGVEIHPLDFGSTRCLQCRVEQKIEQRFCGNCFSPKPPQQFRLCCENIKIQLCRVEGCLQPPAWSSDRFCKRHFSDSQIQRALNHKRLQSVLLPDQIATIFEFAQRNSHT